MTPRRGAGEEFQAVLERGWLAGMPSGFQAAVLEQARLVRYEAGEFTHHIGDNPGGIFGIVSGSFGVMGLNRMGGLTLGDILRRGSWFGHGPMFTGRPRMLAFRAMEPTAVAYVTLQSVEVISQRLAGAGRCFAQLPEYNMNIYVEVLGDLLIRRSDQRIAAVLLRVSGATAGVYPQETGDCAVTQSDLAEMANVSRHTMNAVLKDFAARGWIRLGYGRVAVSDAAGLAAFVTEENPGARGL
ncbi:Crp/Fnr family transcriptional regulator [Ruixingdingia sedimenti]|uniref:Crp/Fnr family transcriptional regulator n=1 Tax=Ruixingdingia sedimenti TaxID=3073604 RepID=A0ABU1F3X6_9RHOB|nr:Crp/Fnr family transcriptional regulator [Xinfangfangia sp. LG-4]MDR5651167.1 Crp/Fnr family transcriptional regulator [Xinfangfangia sp. LG-4]